MYVLLGMTGRDFVRPLLMVLAVATLFANPATAQRLANDDWLLRSELGLGYRLSPQWRLKLDTQLTMAQQMSRVRNLHLRPGIEYAFASHWAVMLGYVQNQSQPATVVSNRGPFQDIAFGFNWERLSIAQRLRSEQLFLDNGSHVIRARYRLSLEHPLGDTPFAVLVSDEVFYNVAVTGNQLVGYNQNRLYGGLAMALGAGARASVGYELISFTPRTRLEQIHMLRVGLAFALN